MGWFDQFKGLVDPGSAYRHAGKEIKNGYNQGQGYLDPYNQAGRGQIDRLTGAQDKLMNPGALQDEWAKNYQMSPYAQQMQEQAKAGGMDAASSQGLLGSSTAINAIQQGSSNIMNADRQQYMNDLMEKYKTGLGIGQDMFHQGGSAAGQMSGNAMDFGKQMGSMEFGKGNAMMNQMMNALKIYMATKGGGMGGGSGGGGYSGGEQYPGYLGY